MRKNITLLLLLTLTNVFGQNVLKFQDTEDKYMMSMDYYNEYNDCTVRAVAEGFNKSYKEALLITQSWGRKNQEGLLMRPFIVGMNKYFAKEIVYGTNFKGTPQDMLEIVEDGYSYIMLCMDHVFVLEQNKVGSNKWIVKGNRGDKKRNLFAYIKVKR